MIKKTTILFAFTLLVFNTLTSQDGVWEDKISEVVSDLPMAEPQDVLIHFQSEKTPDASIFFSTKDQKGQYVFETLKYNAQKAQQRVQRLLTRDNIRFKSFYIVNAIATTTDLNTLIAIAQYPEVRYISRDAAFRVEAPIEPALVATRDSMFIPWGISKIQADKVWDTGITGQGVVIGGQDTGYDWKHPTLQKKYRGYISPDSAIHHYNWHDAIDSISPLNNDSIVAPTNNPCGLNAQAPCDDHNHGTHTMGTMLGADAINKIGVAPGARWIGCRNMERGWGKVSTYLDCFQWFLAPTDLKNENPDPTRAPHVINNSWSCPPIEGCNADNFFILETAVRHLKMAGIVVVVSAGNSGSLGCGSISTPPAIYANSFTIGATNASDTLAGFSSRGPVTIDSSGRFKPDVTAPGVHVYSAVRNGGFARFGGTSMAGPHVAGLVALIIEANPTLAGKVDLIESIIKLSAVQLTAADTCGFLPSAVTPNYLYGYGRIDALAAVKMAQLVAVKEVPPIQNNIVTIYPNPAEDALFFKFEMPVQDATLQIISLNGQIIKTLSLTANNNEVMEIKIENLTKGIYIFKIQNDRHFQNGKFIKL